MTIGSDFSSKRIFVSDYFGAECCCKIPEPDWSRSQFKNYHSCNCNYILFTKLPWPGNGEETYRSSSQAATCPSVYHTRRRLHTLPLIAERQAGKLWIPIFTVVGLNRPGIERELHDINQLELGKFMYQLNWNKLPIIIQSLFTKIEYWHKYNTGQAKTTKLFLPRVSKQMAKTQLSFRRPQH